MTPPRPWTTSQRGVLIAMLTIMLCYLISRLMLNPIYVADPQPIAGPRADELADRIDPNIADANTLAVLPLIGEKRAQDIIAFRDAFVAKHPNQPAFAKLDDLLQIRGIGGAMISQLEPYLIFPTSQPTTTQP